MAMLISLLNRAISSRLRACVDSDMSELLPKLDCMSRKDLWIAYKSMTDSLGFLVDLIVVVVVCIRMMGREYPRASCCLQFHHQTGKR